MIISETNKSSNRSGIHVFYSHYPSIRGNLVSEVKQWVLPDLAHCMMEMKQGLPQMMEHLVARQEEAAAYIAANQEEMKACQVKADAEAKAHQDKADAEAKTRHEQLKEDIKGHMEALLEGLRSCGKRKTAYQIFSVAYPEKSKVSPEEMEAKWLPLKSFRTKLRPWVWRQI
jgi:hypothetical protein